MKNRSIVSLAAAGLAAMSLSFAAPATAQSRAVGFANSNGTVNCEYIDFSGQTYIRCVSDGARVSMPQCSPRNVLVPAFRYWEGRGHKECYNQGLNPTRFQRLAPGQTFRAGSVTAISDFKGGLHFVSPRGYAGYIGPRTVDDARGAIRVSSRAF